MRFILDRVLFEISQQIVPTVIEVTDGQVVRTDVSVT